MSDTTAEVVSSTMQLATGGPNPDLGFHGGEARSNGGHTNGMDQSMLNHRSQTDPGDNVVTIVGYLAPQRVRGSRDESALSIPGRSDVRIHRFSVEVLEPEGIGSQIELEVPSVRARLGLGKLDNLQEDERIVASGRLISRNTHDLRHASEDEPNGRPTRRMLVAVTEIRKANDDDTDGSIVILDGTISEPPAIRPHETQPAVQVGRVTLHVSTETASMAPGSQMVMATKQVIQVDIPIAGESYKFLKAGNRLRVRGRLEVFALALRADQDRFVQKTIANLRAAFEERMATMTGLQRLQTQREFIRQLRNQMTEMRLRVRAQEVTLLTGEQAESIEQVVETRRDYVQRSTEERRARRAHARERNRNANRGSLAGSNDASEVQATSGGAGESESGSPVQVRHRKVIKPEPAATI